MEYSAPGLRCNLCFVGGIPDIKSGFPREYLFTAKHAILARRGRYNYEHYRGISCSVALEIFHKNSEI